MKEDINIKVVHQQIQRLKPIWAKIRADIQKDIENPSFNEYVVRTNPDEKYFIQIIEELIAMYEGYMEATNKLVSQGMNYETPKSIKKEVVTKLPEEEEDEEESVEEDDEQGILYESKPINQEEINSKPKQKIGRRPKKNINQKMETPNSNKNDVNSVEENI